MLPQHPYSVGKLAEVRHQDLVKQAETHRLLKQIRAGQAPRQLAFRQLWETFRATFSRPVTTQPTIGMRPVTRPITPQG